MTMDFNTLLEKYRKFSFSERDKGNRFERLMQLYLLTDPQFADKFQNVWLWNEFFGRDDLGGNDTGIDLVALTTEGDYWAVQCKCFQEDSYIDKPAVDSFLATSGRTFHDEELKTVKFAHRLWISTTNKWGTNAEEAIRNQSPPVTRINLYDLQQSPVDWAKLEKGIHGEAARNAKKSLRPHQKEAMDKVHEYFKTADRGKIIMACGTGKTFNSLRIAENETDGKGLILFLVPSIALLGQTLREWTADAEEPIHAVCICSDPEISRKKTKSEDNDNFSVIDLALPASTNPKEILRQFQQIQSHKKTGMTVFFSTYQSLEVIAKAQKELKKNGFGEFDLVICDEAHRTTGATLAGEDESAFVKIHDNNFIRAKKRLYMTATPRLYNDDSKSKAAQAEAVLCSMDDEKLYGGEIYRIGFGEAVEKDLLTDYKVLILTLNDSDVPPAVQEMIANGENEINSDDASKLIGCVNALSKQLLGDEGIVKSTDPEPMRRALAFCQSIKISKKITTAFNTATDVYINALPTKKKSSMVSIASEHIDGTMSAPKRDELLAWLKAPLNDGEYNGECRILTNVRCLSEGVDVPSLDAVMFLSARNSQVDVVQSVGRVMRKSPGKKYGYIIIPVVVPFNVEADKALDDNERYKVVWTVLNALRAHDDRFNATVNKIELNKKRPQQILVGTPDTKFDDDGTPIIGTGKTSDASKAATEISRQLMIQFEQLQNVIFARMVQKVGDRRYWEQWAKSVAEIAQRQIERIAKLVGSRGKHREAFENFLEGLHKNINPSIAQQDAIETLSQHIITKPVFDSLFEGYSFVQNNPVSKAMQKMLDLLEEQTLEKDTETLQKFYESVKKRASGIDNAEGKQRIIIELYDKFFKTAFPKMAEKLGIVYTPVEVVDFIIHSVNDILKKEFNRSLADVNVNILDPFTGTGTFITRLIQSGLIDKKNLKRKYEREIFANEIVLLAYYIAAMNIENAYHDVIERTDSTVVLNTPKQYTPFEGICLTDTFQLGETDDGEKLFSDMFPKNSKRVQRQKKTPITIIMGNPPYSVGQKSANDNAQNQEYPKLNQRIAETYAAAGNATNKNALYDSYIKAFRWSTDRLGNNDGIIAFVSNGAWLDGNSQDGFRKCLEQEFSSIYIFNLRGNCRTQGELRRKEAGNVFGLGSRTPIAITILVRRKNSSQTSVIHYHDIGDYLSREKKLEIIKKFRSITNMELQTLAPNEHGDWINQRNDVFSTFISLEPKDKFDVKSNSFFVVYSNGVGTSRDAWVWNFSKEKILNNMKFTIDFYNSQVKDFKGIIKQNTEIKVEDFVDTDTKKIAWSSSLIPKVQRGIFVKFAKDRIFKAIYRPFVSMNFYYGEHFIHRRGQFEQFFPTEFYKNLIICVQADAGERMSPMIVNCIPDLELVHHTQCFPLYYYEENKTRQKGLFDAKTDDDYIRRDAASDFILKRCQTQYGKNVTKEDIFYYVYGFLHNKEYRETFAADLKKMLPRLPLIEDVRDFWAFSKAGRKLADLHLNYETVPSYSNVITLYNPLSAIDALKQVNQNELEYLNYRVEKMRFPSKTDKSKIIYNSQITIVNIPEKAYQYVVNGKSAIEWIMERYQITTHKESGIKNDPNDWSREQNEPKYILNLLLSVVNISVQTVEIVESLPKVKF
ncbi:MAG: DEAD/DEAH box helicase family protein [Planctomycetaceae bacterium]|jgi:predicted helicase|nr:DEAD/DEAH box helicase family protein [Planctomycetaceae bacterium]